MQESMDRARRQTLPVVNAPPGAGVNGDGGEEGRRSSVAKWLKGVFGRKDSRALGKRVDGSNGGDRGGVLGVEQTREVELGEEDEGEGVPDSDEEVSPKALVRGGGSSQREEQPLVPQNDERLSEH